jgi:Xaa-Pro dipeptidase
MPVLLGLGPFSCLTNPIQTRTFPISGKFSKESREIYDIVLKMQLECIEMLKEGVRWDDVHLHAHDVAVEGLLALGLLKGDKQAIMESRTSVAFFPHGLGHYLGMDTHDTGGNANYSDSDSMFRYLRVRGHLPAGSVITVEPGVSRLAQTVLMALQMLIRVSDLLLQLYHRTLPKGPKTLAIHRCGCS